MLQHAKYLLFPQLMIPGLLRYEAEIEAHEEVVLMTTKGEAIALGIAMMSTVEMSTCDHGVVAKVKRCIMERDLYPRRWGLGPTATEKKKLKASGKLDKFGRANEQTPAKWTTEYKDYNPQQESAATGASADVTMSEAPAVDITASPAGDEAKAEETPAADDDKKKRKKHDGETAEDKAERKRRKAEKKAAKAKRSSTGGKKEDSDSD